MIAGNACAVGLFGLMVLALTSCATTDRDVENHFKTAVAGAQTFYLSPQAIKETELAASRGSAKAAIKLSEYHGFVRLDLEKQIYWMKKAVKYGARDEQENLDTLLEIHVERRAALKHKASAAP